MKKLMISASALAIVAAGEQGGTDQPVQAWLQQNGEPIEQSDAPGKFDEGNDVLGFFDGSDNTIAILDDTEDFAAVDGDTQLFALKNDDVVGAGELTAA